MKHFLIPRRDVIRAVAAGLAAACFGSGQNRREPTPTERVRVGDSNVEVAFAGTFDLSTADLLDWVHQSALGVARYFGSFPVAKSSLTVVSRSGKQGVSGGRTWARGPAGPRTRITVGEHTDVSDLERDWVLTHEFVHYGFPDMPERHHWIEEGLATYVEPIARVRVGTQDPATAWFEMLRDMPQGEPKPGDEGLDNTHTWGRTYWGGAMYCLLADVSIRKATRNTKGLCEALRGIVAAGGNIDVSWPIERALRIGDQSTGGTTLMSLYEQMAGRPEPVDLDGLWTQLGVERRGDTAVFDDHAPLAAIRKAILS